MYFDFFFLLGVPACMAINVNVQYHGGFLPDIILLPNITAIIGEPD